MRRKYKKKHTVQADPQYNSVKVEQLTNYIMLSGKKNAARKVVYGAFENIKEKAKAENPLEIFEVALKNIGPTVEVRSRRVGGANYQVPREVKPARRLQLSLRWVVDAARSKKGRPVHLGLAEELLAASRGEGDAVKKRENVHKMADANKAFAHFSW
jgi:small subunit ribosomal protein S7